MISNKLQPPISAYLNNYTRESIGMNKNQLLRGEDTHGPCECMNGPLGNDHPEIIQEGHICCTDIQYIVHEELRHLCTLGRQARIVTARTEDLVCIEEALDAYIAWHMTGKRQHNANMYDAWKQYIMLQCKDRYDQNIRDEGIHVTTSLKGIIKEYQKYYVILNVDKTVQVLIHMAVYR